ncbi:hypothetical protein SAZ11_01795 [Streptomyces sp. FXJ1.4098]|nr:hypothetical protein [Streptomyces sp. FXJ1.4098]
MTAAAVAVTAGLLLRERSASRALPCFHPAPAFARCQLGTR